MKWTELHHAFQSHELPWLCQLHCSWLWPRMMSRQILTDQGRDAVEFGVVRALPFPRIQFVSLQLEYVFLENIE